MSFSLLWSSRQPFPGASLRKAFGGAFGSLCAGRLSVREGVVVGFQAYICFYEEFLGKCLSMCLVLAARSAGSGDAMARWRWCAMAMARDGDGAVHAFLPDDDADDDGVNDRD